MKRQIDAESYPVRLHYRHPTTIDSRGTIDPANQKFRRKMKMRK